MILVLMNMLPWFPGTGIPQSAAKAVVGNWWHRMQGLHMALAYDDGQLSQTHQLKNVLFHCMYIY